MQALGPAWFEVLFDLKLILGDRLTWITKLHGKYGDVVRVPMGPRVVHALFHPDGFRHVLVANARNYNKGRTFAKTSAYFGNGLATSEGAAWQIQRRRMNPHFQREALRHLAGIITGTVGGMLERWSVCARQGKIVDLAKEFQRLAMDVVSRSLFGVQVSENLVAAVGQAVKTALDHTASRTLNPIDIPDSLPLPSNRRYRRAVRLLDEVVYQVIADERARPEPSPTLLALLLQATDPETGEMMSNQQLRDEVMTMFLGGTDTSGNTMAWVFYNLHRFAQVQSDVRREIEAVVGQRRPTEEEVPRLETTRRVVEETLRLFPQNWVMSRDAIDDDTISGYAVPAGGTVFLGVYVAHRRPDFWENPETFDPERFLPARAAGRETLAYLPFGAGSRKCIGYHFAMMEICLAIAMVLQRFQFELVHPERVFRHATWSMSVKPGLLARLHEI